MSFFGGSPGRAVCAFRIPMRGYELWLEAEADLASGVPNPHEGL